MRQINFIIAHPPIKLRAVSQKKIMISYINERYEMKTCKPTTNQLSDKLLQINTKESLYS